MSQRNSLQVAEETVNNLKRLFQAVNKQSRNVVCDAGLTGSQVWAIQVLAGEPENIMTVSALARRMHVNASTVVRTLDGLEVKGIVQRVRSLNDRRIVHVSLTEQGREIIRNSPDVAHNLLVSSLRKLSENKLYAIASGLTQVLAAIEAHP